MNEQQFLKFYFHSIQPAENEMHATNLKQCFPERIKINEKYCKLGGDAEIHQNTQEQSHCDLRGTFYKNYIQEIFHQQNPKKEQESI